MATKSIIFTGDFTKTIIFGETWKIEMNTNNNINQFLFLIFINQHLILFVRMMVVYVASYEITNSSVSRILCYLLHSLQKQYFSVLVFNVSRRQNI